MEIENKSFLKTTYLLPAAAIILIGFILVQFTLPQVKGIMKNREILKKEKTRLEQLTKKSTELEKLNTADLRRDFENAENALPSQNDVAGVLYMLARLQSDSQVFLDKIEMSPGLISSSSGQEKKTKTKEKTMSQVEFKVSGVGDLIAVKNFLQRVKEINPQIEITKFDIASSGAPGMEVNFELIFYYQLPPLALGKIDDSLPLLTAGEKEILSTVATFSAYNKIPSTEASASVVGKTNPFE
ncbi:hypothetical protein HY439_01175 [Candidatus Microgenomates bacterium]|nr:hypothetical protein [Candidatus Microgenomates bacterium]